MRCIFILLFLFSSYTIDAQNSPVLNTGAPQFSPPDIQPEFPGGMDSLRQFLNSNVRYPDDARVNGIDGKVYVEFIVDVHGSITPESVQIFKGLYPSCDEEALRLVRIMPKWKPGLKNNYPMEVRFILPLSFVLDKKEVVKLKQYNITTPIKAVIKPKPVRASSPDWSVYADIDLVEIAGKVKVGDTVSVTGWAHRLYFIQTELFRGYISLNALQTNSDLDSLSKIVSEYSNIEQMGISNRPLTDKPKAYFALSSTKSEVYIGECAVVSLAFYIEEENTARIQFVNLNEQAPKLISKQLNIHSCWTSRSFIENIEPESIIIDSKQYYRYTIHKTAYCPTSFANIQFPAMPLRMLVNKYKRGEEVDTVTFNSSPLTIKVKPTPPAIKPSSYDFFQMTGKYTLQDSLLGSGIKVGKPVLYKLTVKCEGLTFPIQPPTFTIDNVSVELTDILGNDTIILDRYHSTRTFLYSLIFKTSGAYDLKGKVKFKYFDPYLNKIISLESTSKFSVHDNQQQPADEENQSMYNKYVNMILLDVSQSMMMEDYKPNRLKQSISGLTQFLLQRDSCDIGLVTFGGEAKPFNLRKASLCYSSALINAIDFSSVKGTAIGDAIWMARNSMRLTKDSKIVIIGDGDNTSGTCTTGLATLIAKKYNIKIYTIGIGTKGLVAMGKDDLGRTLFYSNSFNDKVFKSISYETGGQYFWAKDSAQIGQILKSIFK